MQLTKRGIRLLWGVAGVSGTAHHGERTARAGYKIDRSVQYTQHLLAPRGASVLPAALLLWPQQGFEVPHTRFQLVHTAECQGERRLGRFQGLRQGVEALVMQPGDGEQLAEAGGVIHEHLLAPRRAEGVI